jgi:hypothetical protein
MGKWLGAARKASFWLKNGKQRLLPLAQASSLNVYTQKELVLAVGDSVKITKNFKAGEKQSSSTSEHLLRCERGAKAQECLPSKGWASHLIRPKWD